MDLIEFRVISIVASCKDRTWAGTSFGLSLNRDRMKLELIQVASLALRGYIGVTDQRRWLYEAIIEGVFG